MFYRIKENRLYDYAGYEYAEDCINDPAIDYATFDAGSAKYIIQGDRLVLNPDYDEEAEKEAEYRAKVDALYMTVGDFNGVLISQFGTNLTALRVVVLEYLDGTSYTTVEKELFMNSFDNALNFYRKHPLFNELAGQPPLNVTEEQWDMIFIEVARAKGEWVD